MAYPQTPLARLLMDQMGVADINSFWQAIPGSDALTAVNAQIGRHLGTIEDEHRLMRTHLGRLGRQQASLLKDLDEGVYPDSMWISHYSKKVAENQVAVSTALSNVRELMAIRALLVATAPKPATLRDPAVVAAINELNAS